MIMTRTTMTTKRHAVILIIIRTAMTTEDEVTIRDYNKDSDDDEVTCRDYDNIRTTMTTR